jgi:hypothetical protein
MLVCGVHVADGERALGGYEPGPVDLDQILNHRQQKIVAVP